MTTERFTFNIYLQESHAVARKPRDAI